MFRVPPERLQRILLTLHQTHTPCGAPPSSGTPSGAVTRPTEMHFTLPTYPDSEAFLDLLSEPQRTSPPLDQPPKTFAESCFRSDPERPCKRKKIN
ncbi:hypothetical protein CHARACLAT_026990 [Characodon lateralis]|uniref:Uncharacterized protein n=1 Tax=Characodon lateralis TaxID=208331 RepID=A0ABU7EYK8_9TELE|nr:hypothetical protein [Characodon lateralis]